MARGSPAGKNVEHKYNLSPAQPGLSLRWSDVWGVFKYARRALGLVWSTSKGVTVALAIGAVLAGAAPTAMAWAGKRLIDSIVQASASGLIADRDPHQRGARRRRGRCRW